jgi:hypothetical protein
MILARILPRGTAMQQFIPFEDDWDALERLRPEALIPYRVGLVPAHSPEPLRAGSSAGPKLRGTGVPCAQLPPGGDKSI